MWNTIFTHLMGKNEVQQYPLLGEHELMGTLQHYWRRWMRYNFGKPFGSFLKVKPAHALWLAVPLIDHTTPMRKESICSYQQLYMNIHSNIICNSKNQ